MSQVRAPVVVDGPKLSIQLPSFAATDPGGWAPVLALAGAADDAGIDRVSVSDHVVFGERLDAYADPTRGGTSGAKQPTGPDGHWLEPLTLLAVLAGTTKRVRLGTGILLAALRRPAVLAKQVATLDVLSGGRVDLGVGVGWQREEYEACGLDFGRRGDLLDHTLAVCQLLWREQVADFDDEELHLERIHSMPKPLQAAGVPIWVSGRINARTLRRVVRHGSGWIPWGDHVIDPAEGIVAMRRALEDAGRDPDDLRVQGSIPLVRTREGIDVEKTMARVPELTAAGVTDFLLLHRWLDDADVSSDLLARAVVGFRHAVGHVPR